MPSHICRFKVLSVKSPDLVDDLGYLIHYIRGGTDRTSPTSPAKNGEVDFSKMPEGSAVLHFKTGRSVPGCPYAPKYITFQVLEYFSNAPSRTVGETTVDCTPIIAKDPMLKSAQGLQRVKFRLYGKPDAEMTVAILVYSKGLPHLQFDSLIEEWRKLRKPGSESPATHQTIRGKNEVQPEKEKEQEKIRVMEKEEAKTLLISLEALQERQSRSGLGTIEAFPELTAEIEQLESKRKTLVGSEGLANKVVQGRCHGCVAAQFRELHYRYRANFIGTTAAYLRQMALTDHYVPKEEEIMDFLKEQTGEKNSERAGKEKTELKQKMENVEKQLNILRTEKESVERKLQQLQLGGNIEKHMPLILTTSSLLDKLDHDIKVQEDSKASLEKQLQSLPARAVVKAQPLPNVTKQDASLIEAEIMEIKERIRSLKASELETNKKINRMKSVAITHIIAWARTKGALQKETEVLPSVDDLFSAPPAAETPVAEPLAPKENTNERDALLHAFDNLSDEKAEEPHKRTGSDASSASKKSPKSSSSEKTSRSSSKKSSRSSSSSSSSEDIDNRKSASGPQTVSWGPYYDSSSAGQDNLFLKGILSRQADLSMGSSFRTTASIVPLQRRNNYENSDEDDEYHKPTYRHRRSSRDSSSDEKDSDDDSDE